MWAAIRSDLNEFVTTVKDESATVTEAVLKKEGEQTENREATQQEESDTGESPMMMVGEDGDVVMDNDAAVAAEEVDRRIAEPATFTAPLDEEDPEVVSFLESFDVESKTDDISALLEENSETLKVQFEALVPEEVEYKDFWQRYYFRCDQERILSQWEAEQEEARRKRAEAIESGIKTVKNLFGGAVKAVSNTVAPKKPAADSTYSHLQANNTAAPGGALAMFGSGQRPPFVMNTAVDEDEEEEEEEELGWDDDDSFEDESEEEDGADETEEASADDAEHTEVIEFSGGKNEEIENLKQQLEQALEEREILHKTVEMQTKEIANLRLTDSTENSDEAKKSSAPEESDETEKLKIALFEKDAELAALKASLEDTQDEDKEASAKKDAAKLASQERELEKLREEIMKKDGEMAELKGQHEKSAANAEQLASEVQATKAALAEAESSQSESLMQINSVKEMLATSQAETESLRVSLESHKRDSASQDLKGQEDAAAARSEIESLKAELEESKGSLEFTNRRAEHLEQELQKTKEEMQQKESEFEAQLAAEIAKVHAEHEQLSSGTSSTGVKVASSNEADTPTPVANISAAEEEDDDWGDDWGDDDED